MTIKNIVIFILIGIISWLIIVNIGEDELHQNEIKDLKTQNEVLLSKNHEDSLKLITVALKQKESDKKINTLQNTTQTKQIQHHERIIIVSAFNSDEAYDFLKSRYYKD